MFSSLKCVSILRFLSRKNYRTLKTLSYEQTSIHTHPHIFGHGKLKGILKEEYNERRFKLCDKIKLQDNQSSHLIIIPSQRVQYKSQDVPFKFHQDTNFLYMSGYKLSDSILILSIINNTISDILFIKETSTETQLWEGPSSNRLDLTEVLGIEKIENITELRSYLNSLKDKSSHLNVWCKLTGEMLPHYTQEISQFLTNNQSMITNVQSVDPYIQRLRLIKSPAEQSLVSQSCQIAGNAFAKTVAYSHPNVQESLLEAKFDFEVRQEFASGLAYPPVVAGGDRACTIHYIANNQLVHADQLVLMDAGCEYQEYCSDITRTWPINGRFTKYQGMVYEALLDVQEQCIKCCQPKDMSLNALLNFMYSAMIKNYEDIGIIPKNLTQPEKFDLVSILCPHHIGHHLGLDIHDCSAISRKEPFTSGMVITVEPGFYVPSKDTRFPPEFRGMGIRIEDDILITSEGCGHKILTRNCPRSVKELEKLMMLPSSS